MKAMESAIIGYNSVKIEPSAVCHGCLSTGRILKPLQGNTDTFLSLLDHLTVTDCKITNTLLCWECTANLRRFQKFRNRIQNAQWMLQQSQYLLDHSTPTLSSLCTVKINNEINLQHEEITIKDNKINIVHNTLDVKDVVCKEENIELSIEYDNIDNDNVQYSDEDIKLEYNKKLKKEKRVKTFNESKSFTKNYAKKAKITSNPEIDLNEPEKHYSKVFLSASEIEEMIKKEDKGKCFMKRRFNCKVCKRGYKTGVHLKRHQTFQHPRQKPGTYRCLECKASFPTQRELETHWDAHNYVLQCDMCERRMTLKRDMLQHIAYHSNIFTCLVCEMQFNCSKDFSKHYKELHKRLICDDCGLNFTNKNSILKHMRRHHFPHRCIECNKDYKTYKSLTSHYSFCHPSLVYKGTDASLSYCVECDKQFGSVNLYKRHLHTAAAHRRAPRKRLAVPCPGCDKVFSRKVYMKNHYTLIHAGKTKHYCSLCDKYFITAHAARKHHRYVHEKVALPKNKICDICGRGFSTNRILIHHRRTHTGERPHHCPHCAAAFAQDTALKTHVRTQHKIPVNN